MQRIYDKHARAAHERSMSAKDLVLKAQDALDQMKLPGTSTWGLRRHKAFQGKMRKELDKARVALAAFDKIMFAAKVVDNDLCNCGAFPDGLEHKDGCLLHGAPRLP